MHQELAIPVAFSRGDHAVFNIHQGGHDFTDEDLALARQLQPLLMLLDRQAALSAQLTLGLTERFQLTSRQVAILSLLREGRSVPAIGARLCCSPRTVEKHVEHIYRKLGVRDRLSAVRVAEMYDAANAHEAREGSRTARTGLGLDHGGRRDLLVLSGTLQSAEPLYPSRPLDAMTA
jgi:DNA-binding CsgD family transcriptional regulator